MQFMATFPVWLAFPEALIIHLPGGFASAPFDRKAGHRGDAISGRTEGSERFWKSEAQGTDNAGGYHSDAAIFYVRTGKSHASTP
jgi:hypothetical protein